MTDIRLTLKAEWEPQSEILLVWPDRHTDWEYMLDEVRKCVAAILEALHRHGSKISLLVRDPGEPLEYLSEDVLQGLTFVKTEYNDTWIRDYGPLSLALEGAGDKRALLADFGFNGWGLKFASDLDNLVTYRCFSHHSDGSPNPAYLNCRGYELEGGSVETDGRGTLLTTSRCLCSPNRNGGLSKDQVERRLARLLGIRHFLWLDHGYLAGDDTDSHIDTLARLCPGDVIIYTGCRDNEDEHYNELQAMATQLKEMRTPEGKPYSLVELPLPSPFYDPDDGHRLPATYANYLVTDNAVLVPVYGRPEEDRMALDIIRSVYSDRVVEGIDCRALIRQHGSLHCATMQLNR